MKSILWKLHWRVLVLISSIGNHIQTQARSKQVPFIVNGWEADRGRWPWQVTIMLGVRTPHQVCGGVLLSSRFILSAAHCTQYDPVFYKVWIGGHNLNSLEEGQLIGVRRMINHPQYNGSSESFPNDISLVELSRPATLDVAARPAVLPETGESFLNNECYISGWGKTDSRFDKKPKAPHEVNMTVLSQSACRSAMADEKDKQIFDTHICVIHESKSASACQGDSGGPLQCRRSRVEPWIVAGVTSWGKGDENITCYQSHPSVYTRVSSYIDWIKRNTDSSIKTSGNTETTSNTPKETTASPVDNGDTTSVPVGDKRTTIVPYDFYTTLNPTDESRTTANSDDNIGTTVNSIDEQMTTYSNGAGTSLSSLGDKRTTFGPMVNGDTTVNYLGERQTTARFDDHTSTTVTSTENDVTAIRTSHSIGTNLISPGEKRTTSGQTGSTDATAKSKVDRTTVQSGDSLSTTANNEIPNTNLISTTKGPGGAIKTTHSPRYSYSPTVQSGDSLSTTANNEIPNTKLISTTKGPGGAIKTTHSPRYSYSTVAKPAGEEETTATHIYERDTTLNTSDGVSANNTLRGFVKITTLVFNGTTQSTQRSNPNIISGYGVTRGRYFIIELLVSLYVMFIKYLLLY